MQYTSLNFIFINRYMRYHLFVYCKLYNHMQSNRKTILSIQYTLHIVTHCSIIIKSTLYKSKEQKLRTILNIIQIAKLNLLTDKVY